MLGLSVPLMTMVIPRPGMWIFHSTQSTCRMSYTWPGILSVPTTPLPKSLLPISPPKTQIVPIPHIQVMQTQKISDSLRLHFYIEPFLPPVWCLSHWTTIPTHLARWQPFGIWHQMQYIGCIAVSLQQSVWYRVLPLHILYFLLRKIQGGDGAQSWTIHLRKYVDCTLDRPIGQAVLDLNNTHIFPLVMFKDGVWEHEVCNH